MGQKERGKKQEIVLKVDMDCEACARKIARALKGFQGVEEVTADYRASTVVVKGKEADPVKVSHMLHNKSATKVELVSPLPNPPKEDRVEEKKPKEEEKKEEKRMKKIKGVDSVETDATNDKVMVKAILDPEKLVHDVYKKTRKKASVVKEEEEKKEEEKKEEEKRDEEEKKDGENDHKLDIKRSEYWPSRYYVEYSYPHSQMFSDKNPNACSVM